MEPAAKSRKGGALAPPAGPSPTTSWSPLSRSRERGWGERAWPVTAGLKPRPSAAIFIAVAHAHPLMGSRNHENARRRGAPRGRPRPITRPPAKGWIAKGQGGHKGRPYISIFRAARNLALGVFKAVRDSSSSRSDRDSSE